MKQAGAGGCPQADQLPPDEIGAAPDETLVALCLRNEAAAWRALVTRHGRLVYSIARRAGLSEEDAADVVQSVFLTLMESLPNLRKPEHLGAWLAITTKRAAWRASARAAVARQMATPEDPEGGSDAASGPAERALEAEDRRQLAAAFHLLDGRSQRLLWLLFCDPGQPSYDRIASELRIRKGSVGPLRARALAKLKGLYEQVANPSSGLA